MRTTKARTANKIIVVLLVFGCVLVASFGGYVIWKSFLSPQAPPAAKSQREDTKKTPVVIPDPVASDETLGSGFAITYPKAWTNAHTGAVQPRSTSEVQTDENVITSPSGNIQVILKVQTNTQIGGACTSDYIKLRYLAADATPQYSEARFAAYVVFYPGTSFYQYHAGLQKNTEVIRGVNLNSNTACGFMFSEFLDRKSSLPGVPPTRTILSIRFVDLYRGVNLKSGVNELRVAEKLSGSEYEQAKAIVQSVYIK